MSWLFFFWEICSISLNRLKIKVTTLKIYIQTTFVIKHMAMLKVTRRGQCIRSSLWRPKPKILFYPSCLLRHLRYSALSIREDIELELGSKKLSMTDWYSIKVNTLYFCNFLISSEKVHSHCEWNTGIWREGKNHLFIISSNTIIIVFYDCVGKMSSHCWGMAILWQIICFTDSLQSPLSQHHYLYWVYWQPLCLWRKHFIVLFSSSQNGKTEKWVSTIKWSFILTMNTMYVHTSTMILQWLVYRDEKVLGRLENEMKK